MTHSAQTESSEEQSPCGRYIRYRKIMGRGAFKEVYRGLDRAENVEIAWNQIAIDDEKDLGSHEIRENLCSEAVLLKSLSHKNVMKCFDYWIGPTKKSMNMITELSDSGSIRQQIKKHGEIDPPTMKVWGRQILNGLKYLHGQNPRVVHRDLKCANVFLDVSSDSIKIGDFGLATAVEKEGTLRTFAGTPEFMAPEYYDEEYNESVDVYAFGMCLLEMATCECPYSECAYPAQIFKKVISDVKPIALSKVSDQEVKRVIERCLLPADSRPSASELLKDPFFFGGEVLDGGDSASDVAFSMEDDGGDDYYMDESILSDISALYDDDDDACGKGGEVEAASDNNKPCCCLLVDDDVSMRSKVTFESASWGGFNLRISDSFG